MNFREQLDTPALVVHDEILQKNLTEMADYAAGLGITLRPHFKTHKSVVIARRPEVMWLGCAALPEACIAATDPAAVALQAAIPATTAEQPDL